MAKKEHPASVTWQAVIGSLLLGAPESALLPVARLITAFNVLTDRAFMTTILTRKFTQYLPDWAVMPVWASLSLVIAALCVFAPVVEFDFINWDDPVYVWHNDLIKSWSAGNLLGIATETVTRNYAPLTIFSFLLDHTLWQMNAGGYHATSLLIHIVNGLLVFMLVRRLSQDVFVAWLTAALFLVHPVQIETVAWISSRKGLLSGTFMLAALCWRLKQDLQARDEAWYTGLLVAALLSKALAVVLPPIVLLYDLLIRKEKFTDAVVRQFIPGLLSLLLLLYTMGAQNSIMGGIRGHMDLSLLHIAAIDVIILWRYVGMMLWPQDLCVLYDPATQGIAASVGIGLAAWAVVAALIYRYRVQKPVFLWMMATWLLLLFPVLNFFRITTLMNDRYLYLPCIVFFAAACSAIRWCVYRATDSFRNSNWLRPTALAAAACSLVFAASTATRSYLPVWKNSETLWAYAMQHVPQLVVVHIQTALNLHDTGRVREAIAVLENAQQVCRADELDQRRIRKTIDDWNQELIQVASREIQR